MFEKFESALRALMQGRKGPGDSAVFDATSHFDESRRDEAGVAESLGAAFLIILSGAENTQRERARAYLKRMAESTEWRDVAAFYQSGLERVRQEIEEVGRQDPGFAEDLDVLAEWLSDEENIAKHEETTERIWSLLFPEAVGARSQKQTMIDSLRAKRKVTISQLNPDPVRDPANQILFTSNVLLTIPLNVESIDALPMSGTLKERLRETCLEPQLYWYDHPIPIGVKPESNEILHGLRGLDEAVEFEVARGNARADARIACVLSVSVTHAGLQRVARKYIEEECESAGGFKRIDVYVVTEAATQQLIDEVLVPAAKRYLNHEDARKLLEVFGVNGKYGRHYNLLKAIAPLWQILIQSDIRATFKIDLDQVFPQKTLVEESGHSAFEHLMTPLWGAHGIASNGRAVELGQIAGALVNERDIAKSLFTPDVTFPQGAPTAEEHVFFSHLPQALSTEAEMMTRYTPGELDGERACIQRVHVTGGTNGILVDSLRRHQLFVPSFFGRAEDQAYILSGLLGDEPDPGYVHEDGLIMRHDKEVFAQAAMESAYVGKLLGDYVRILYFSAYAKVLSPEIAKLKDLIDPFTGCFVSRIPVTVVYLRFALKSLSFFETGDSSKGIEFVQSGAQRLGDALDFAFGERAKLGPTYREERAGWNLYYQTLTALEDALGHEDSFALEFRERARAILGECAVRFDPQSTGARKDG